VAGGYGQAEALEEHLEMLLELVESLQNFGQTLSVTRAVAPRVPARSGRSRAPYFTRGETT
jgi:hypothetical protein